MGPFSGASTATCSGLKPHTQSTARHIHDHISSTQSTKQVHNSAMPDVVMAEADEGPVSYSRRGCRICLPATFQATPCHDSQVPAHAFMCADAWKIKCKWWAAAVFLHHWHNIVNCASPNLCTCNFAFIKDGHQLCAVCPRATAVAPVNIST